MQQYIADHQARGILPGVVVAYQYGYDDIQVQAFGVDGAGHPLSTHSIFPVASITKLALALAVHRLCELGHIHLTHALAAYLSDVHPHSAHVTIDSLLCHTAGYDLDLPNKEGRYALGLTWPALAHECMQTPPSVPAWQRVQYSNLGYGLLGCVIERVTGIDCADALHQLVFQPLGINAWLGIPPAEAPLAMIGDVRGRHKGTELETYNSRFWQSLALPWGGMCTDASGALTLARAFLPQHGFLQDDYLEQITRDATRGLPGGFVKPLMWDHSSWGLGPELRGDKQPHWVDESFPAHSFGHSGASGMLAWTDPDHLHSIAILGARVADGGWLLRHGPALTRAIRQHCIA